MKSGIMKFHIIFKYFSNLGFGVWVQSIYVFTVCCMLSRVQMKFLKSLNFRQQGFTVLRCCGAVFILCSLYSTLYLIPYTASTVITLELCKLLFSLLSQNDPKNSSYTAESALSAVCTVPRIKILTAAADNASKLIQYSVN